ncbi:MAG: ChaN family lipoprotein [Nitrospiraceae bacterium]|nr:ChaN family lipoprotein [Nitrospiraceae bacterium]
MFHTGKSSGLLVSFSLFLFLSFFAATGSAKATAAAGEKATACPEYGLFVSFNLQKHLVEGDAVIEVPPAGIEISMTGLRMKYLGFNGDPVPDPAGDWLRINQKGRLEIRYERVVAGEFAANPLAEGAFSGDMISGKGIFLTGNWYPRVRGVALYRLKALVPDGFRAVSEADEITVSEARGGRLYSFDFPHPAQGLELAAAHFAVTKASFGGVDIYTYLFPKDAGLAGQYIEYTKKYLGMDEKALVPYPYKRFSVVENIFPTGLSMPTFTLLGAAIIHYPFVLDESLGHEITHQWFGNWVYADLEKGNWLEAITVYMSDYRYACMRGEGRQYRKKALTDFQSYVHAGNDFPLRRFYERTDPANAAIGYGKGMMLFYMLEKIVGHDVFYKSLRAFIRENEWRAAGWDGIEKVFEKESGMRLGWFFSQWLDRKGEPALEVEGAKFLVSNGVPTVSLDMAQQGKPYRLALGVRIFAGGRPVKSATIVLDAPRQKFQWALNERPDSLVIDGDYEVMRRLSRDEFPPLISRLLGSEKRVVVYGAAQKGKYASLLAGFSQDGFSLKEEKDITDKDIRDSSLLALGPGSPVLKRLFGKVESPEVENPAAGFVLAVRKNPLNVRNVVAMAWGRSKHEVDMAAPLIFHYGGYSTITFSAGKNTGKKTAASPDGIAVRLSAPVLAVASANLELDGVINAVSAAPVIFIGERHTYYGDHMAELDVIMALHRMGRRFAIGMEMFQIPVQKSIDDFIAGKISERRFLKETGYFSNWGYNYDLYRPILEYARANAIPVVALNISKEIADKVAHGGLEALSPAEKKQIPLSMDMSDAKYRKELEGIFATHPKGISFPYFYQAQILWDETMARSVARYLGEHPGSQMVVLAGAGHIAYGYGIPGRFGRRTGNKYVTLVNGSYDRGVADYVLFPEYREAPEAPMLGIVARRQSKEGVEIEEVVPGGPAMMAGLRAGDLIVSIDDWKVSSVSDVKIALFDKAPGQKVTVKVRRRRFLIGRHEMAVKVTL